MSQEQAYFCEQEHRLHELHMASLKLKQLKEQADEIKSQISEVSDYIAGELNFGKDGQKSYDVCGVSLTINKPMRYKVNTTVYSKFKDSMSPDRNPIKEKISYEVDKKKFHNILNFCSDEDKKFFDEIISKNFGSVTIKVK